MGKYIETKYSNVQNRVIKPAKKKRKIHAICEKASNLKSEDKDVPVKPIKEDIYQLQYHIKENFKHHRFYLSLLEKDDDLFCTDILKARYDQYTKCDFLFSIFDEIALEGLDGITIEGFWKRVNVALKNPPSLQNIKEIIWKCICLNKNICFFELPEARDNLNICVTHGKEVLGMDMTASKKKSEIYKIECAPKGNIWGSCSTLKCRVDISDKVHNMSLSEVYNTYQNKLVMVANQTLRTNALFHESADINYDIMPIEYCILEKIGRSRTLGEITLGAAAIGIDFNMNSKSVHHYGKRLSKQNLITKQFFSHKTSLDQIKIGSVLHLKRFYVKNRSNLLLVTEAIIDYLKKCPNYRSDYTTFKAKFEDALPVKYFKSTEVLKYLSSFNPILYRDMYPNAIASQYMIKGMSKERIIRTIQLKNPYINVVANWSDTTNAETSEDEDENEDSGYLIGKGRSFNIEFSKELYLMIRSKGLQGCSIREINDTFDVDFGTIRACTKKLVKAGVVYIKRCDEGKQRHDQYIAKCIINNELVSGIPYQPQNVSTIEKMKQRQNMKMESVNKDQIYTREQFEAEYNLTLNKPSYLPVSTKVPSITCSYLITSLSTDKIEECIIKSQFSSLLTLHFKLNLTLPQLVDQIKFNISTLKDKTNKDNVDIMRGNGNITSEKIYNYNYKPDHLMKVFLMLALLRKLEINRKDVIDFLNTNNKKDKGIKRKHSKISEIKSEAVSNSASSSRLLNLCDYMGPNPISLSKEKGEYDVDIELIMSTLPRKFVSGNLIIQYTFNANNDANLTERLLSRIKIVLHEVNTLQICKEIQHILKTIRNKEKEEGYNMIIDKKSLHRIIRKLVAEGYIKVFQVHISNANLKRTEVFICHPRVNHNNEVIKTEIQQIVWKHFGCGDRKIVLSKPIINANDESKISPFGRKDVKASIRELKCLNRNKQITVKVISSSSKSGKLYGYRPKFSKMSVLHELLFYLIYELDNQAQALSKAETLSLFQSYQINLTDEDLEKLPPVFYKELSWKMFIPPLPHHQYWSDGWALICDIILRMPISLITKVHCISFYSTELLDLLHHPIKRFYLLKNLSPQLHNVIMYRRKYIHSISDVIARLGYCGLLQFGPSKYQEKDQIFIYLNRKASLLETMNSEPAYHKVTVKNYNKIEFTFNTMDDVLNYWSTLHTISMNTPLNSKYIMGGKTITLEKEKDKASLQKVFDARTQEQARNFDNGTIPGDHRGAAGLDSALWPHIKRNWFYFGRGYKSQKFKDDLESLKFEQVRERVSFQQLKLPSGSTKFFIPKIQAVGNLITTKPKKLKGKREARIVKRKMPVRKPTKVIKKYYDDVDKAIFKNYKGAICRFKPSWSDEEDKLLIILKIAAKFLNPKEFKSGITNTTLRDILHRIIPASHNKIASAIPRRWKILKRDIPSIVNIDFWVSNLFKLDKIQQFFLPLRSCLQNEHNLLGEPFKLYEAELQNAFIFLCYYIITHRKEVESTLDGNMTTVDYFNSDNTEFVKSNLVSMHYPDTKYTEPIDKDTIRKNVLTALFHSVLGARKDDPAWSYQLYKVFQKFSDSSLKSVITEMKEQKMMAYRKDMIKKFDTPYKIGLHYIFSQCTIFNYNTVEETFYTFSSVKSKALQFNRNYVEEKNYGQLIALHEMTTILWNNINLKFDIPENPFILNPNMDDHSELIEELAKRYQIKLKNEAKELELSIQAENENVNKNTDLMTSVLEQTEILQLDDDYEPLDLKIPADSETINNLKHWISDCIDTEKVRSPSPELLMFEDGDKIPIKEEVLDSENAIIDYKILSIDEIKKEMLKVTSKEDKRIVPYITDLTKLLTENFDEIETDESTIDRLKKHFVQQYPSLMTFEVDAFDSSITESLENKMKINNLWQIFFNKQCIMLPSQPTLIIEEIFVKLRKKKHGRSPDDINLINRIITFIDEKKVLGASGHELKNEFEKDNNNIDSLKSIISILLQYNIIIRAGVCSIRFVHYNYASEWLLESFILNDIHKVVEDNKTFDELRQQIDSNMKVTSWIKIKLQPWIKVDGTINKDLLKLWMSTILSYCIENPKISMQLLCNKFCFMAPVDIYHLLEVLQDLDCLEIRRFLPRTITLFSEFEILEDTKATFLDNFEDMFIDIKSMPFTRLGAFLYNI